MKKRSLAALVAAVAVIAGGILISLFFATSGERDAYVITLPSQDAAVIDPSHEIGQSNREQLEIISVNKTNIQAVVSSLKRPEVYSCRVSTTYYYRDTATVLASHLWKQQTLVRISQMDAAGAEQEQILLTGRATYLWGAGETAYQRFPRQEQDIDLYSRAPSYENLLLLSGDQIREGKIVELDGHLCLYAKTEDPVTGEVEQWYILVENGLLLYADGMLDGKLTYQTQITDLQLSMADPTVFLLPNGARPE